MHLFEKNHIPKKNTASGLKIVIAVWNERCICHSLNFYQILNQLATLWHTFFQQFYENWIDYLLSLSNQCPRKGPSKCVSAKNIAHSVSLCVALLVAGHEHYSIKFDQKIIFKIILTHYAGLNSESIHKQNIVHTEQDMTYFYL